MSKTHMASADTELKLSGPDGPYARFEQGRLELLYVNKLGNVVRESRNPKLNSVVCRVDNKSEDSFVVSIQEPMPIGSPESEYPAPRLIVVISDIEGNFEALYSLLVSNKIINSEFEWIFDDNDLVILGDAIDKGENITQCLWLIYHLEYQAQMQGGKVHYLLGNHELMNLQLDVRYVPDKYLTLARKIFGIVDLTEAYSALLDHNTVLVEWIKKRNCMEKIGDTLFVHAGISPEFLYQELSIQQTNSILHQYLNYESANPKLVDAVLGGYGPLWYRGLVRDSTREFYEKVDETFIDQVLEFYGVKRIVIGHTVVDHVSADYSGKVWRVDFLHSPERFSKKSEALLIEGNSISRINGKGERRFLQNGRSKRKENKKTEWRFALFNNNHTSR